MKNVIQFTEGSIMLPAGYEDRSTNLLVPANPQVQPNLSVARDWMQPGETLATYIDRQLGVLKSQLAGHRLLVREPVRLGPAAAASQDDDGSGEAPDATPAPPADSLTADTPPAAPPAAPTPLVGERIAATYKSGKQTIYQRQAAFEVAALRVLVFTATSPQPLGAEFDALWNDWLESFVPAAPAVEAPPGSASADAPSTGA